MHFPGSKKRCFYALPGEQKKLGENIKMSIFSLAILLILPYFWPKREKKKKKKKKNRVPSILGLRLKVTFNIEISVLSKHILGKWTSHRLGDSITIFQLKACRSHNFE